MKNERGSLLIIGVILIAIIAIYFITKYNSFVIGEEKIENSRAQIENQMQRRFDLIPNLVSTVKGYMDHEQDIFLQLADARTQYGNANSIDELSTANNELSSALSNLFVVVENYPELKSNEQFNRLMDELAGAENRIAVARKDYNDVVQKFNSRVRKMPGNIIASMFGFEQKNYFEVDEGVDEIPTVNFGSDE